MSPARLGLSAALAAVCIVSNALGAQEAPSAPSWQWTRVSYLSGESVYIDAGTSAGLREGAKADVMRRDSVVAVLEILYVSSSRASGRAISGGPIVLGDSVRFLAAPEIIAGAAGAAAASSVTGDGGATTPRTRRQARAITGRVGLRYMDLQTGTGANGRLTQPAVDLRLEGHRMSGSPIGLVVDARAHRQTSGSGRTVGSTRVYQSMLEYQGAGPLPVRVSVGRQLSTVLSPLGFFDGVTVDVDRKHWQFGVLGGTQPDFANFRPSADIREGGTWVQWHNATGSGTIVQTTLGAVGSYATAGINREFALASTMVVTPVFSLYATQELDVNRGWRKDAEGGQGLSPTSTFATLRVTVTPALSLQGGYDSRRSVRLYRDFLTPDIAFDDAFRRGYWGGAALSIPHLYLSVDSRTSDGLTVGRNQSHTATLSMSRITPLQIGGRARATRYDGPAVRGTLTSVSLEIDPWNRLRMEATVGRRNDESAFDGMIPAKTTWLGLDADAGIGRSWYVMFSSYREIGPSDRLLQSYAGLSWRF